MLIIEIIRTTFPTITKYGFRPKEAAYALGSEKLLEEVVAAGWLKPVVRRHKLTLYDGRDIAVVWTRILGGESPLNGDHRNEPLRAVIKGRRR